MTQSAHQDVASSVSPFPQSVYNDQILLNKMSSSGDAFFHKLVQIKDEQKQTMLYLQDLFNQKQQLKEELMKSGESLMTMSQQAHPHQVVVDPHKYERNMISAYEKHASSLSPHVVVDFINMQHAHEAATTSERPPLPQPPQPKQHSFHASASVSAMASRHDHDHEDDDDYCNNNKDAVDGMTDDLKRIEKIWNEFQLDETLKSRSNTNNNNNSNEPMTKKSIEFNKRFQKVKRPATAMAYTTSHARSSSLVSSKKSLQQYEWCPRVTVPEPFSMTLRDQMRAEKKQKKSAEEIRREREHKLEQQLQETSSRTFKATPVPAHVFLPLYEKKQLDEKMRKFRQQELRTRSSVRTRRNSYTEGEQRLVSASSSSSQFSAKPLPEFYTHEDKQHEKAKEVEMFKQMRTKMRALELLKKSKMPKNMLVQQTKRRSAAEQASFFPNDSYAATNHHQPHHQHHHHNHDVPDYDEMYRRFVVDFEKKQAEARKTIKVEPFKLLTETRAREHTRHEEYAYESNSNFDAKGGNCIDRLNKSLSTSMDAFPTKNTVSYQLRERMNRQRLEEETKKELQREHIEKIKRIKEKNLQDKIQEKIRYDPKDEEKKIERKTRELRLEQRTREEEYDRHLNEINSSLENKKLQIERLEEEKIRKVIEKKYQDVLKKVGIQEDRLNSKTDRVARSVAANYTLADDTWANE